MSNLICTIELDKLSAQGITIEVKDKNGLKRHIQLNDTGITLSCSDDSNSSTITQKPDSIELSVEDGPSLIKMEKDKIQLHCKQLLINADEGIEITSKQDTKITAKQKLMFKSTQNTTMSADQAIELAAGTNAQITANANIKVKATAKADFEGNITTVKGSLTNIKGALVKLG